ncbi:tetratricopeptide repeat protein [Zobellia galactanivorans]|uniref:Aerotolerance protein BatE n=1 Tax=Zobellia galactanivorans (strain DSM 12802 / CCUG 47099 / CIP 106680 / NCIMB 13871 / Dsij) TaxID=63186 RepID=G0LAU0_ZOBGA|nr:tetratricopeptide repeat protein [Zobellia galactanivorans]MBU3027978.1 tetratricopeptide repeat protein [Zobellia galactanivorans]MDO6808257.1 tetratricopeptide repeat protein [Zobellia galactanivorans]CAZ95558.1 Aerotolerance protein BatE [Zobellia galactanivorans]
MRQIFFIVIAFVTLTVSGQNKALFDQATEAYNVGEYQRAVDSYLEILQNGQHSAELYYNLGNAYYKLNQIAPSIYYYEKALLLKPNDSEIKNNLGYAQNMTLDAIDRMPATGLTKIYDSTIGILSFDQWAYASIVFMILFVLLYIAFYYFHYSSRKRLAFIFSMISLLAMLTSVVFAFLQHSEFEADDPAIVFAKEASVKSEPNKRSLEAFTLHEGTKVNVLEELNDWKKIRIPDGTTGWIQTEDIKILKDF